jgi:hypothetical protein
MPRTELLHSALGIRDYYDLTSSATSAFCRYDGIHLLGEGHDPLDVGGLCAQQPPVGLILIAILGRGTQLYVLLVVDVLSVMLLLLAPPTPSIIGGLVTGVLFLPWIITSCYAGFTVLRWLAVLVALRLGARGYAPSSATALASAAMLAPDAAWMIFSAATLAAPTTSESRRATSRIVHISSSPLSIFAAADAAVRCASAFSLALCVWTALLAPQLCGPTRLFRRTVGAWFDAEPVIFSTPNVGPWWCFMAEVFMRPRPTCLFAVNVLLRLCVPCLTLFIDEHRPPCVLPPLVQGIRSPPHSERPLPPGLPSLFTLLASPSRRPSLLCAALSNAMVTATKPAPSLPEIFIALAFVGAQLGTLNLKCSCRVVLRSRWAILSTAVFARSLLLCWMDGREINANFLYGATVLLSAGPLLLVYAVCSASLHAPTTHELAATRTGA